MDTLNLSLDVLESEKINYLQPNRQQQNTERSRAWRRKTNFTHRGHDCHQNTKYWKPEKNFKLLYQRTDKLKRARQLGFEYPQVSAELYKRRSTYEYWILTD